MVFHIVGGTCGTALILTLPGLLLMRSAHLKQADGQHGSPHLEHGGDAASADQLHAASESSARAAFAGEPAEAEAAFMARDLLGNGAAIVSSGSSNAQVPLVQGQGASDSGSCGMSLDTDDMWHQLQHQLDQHGHQPLREQQVEAGGTQYRGLQDGTARESHCVLRDGTARAPYHVLRSKLWWAGLLLQALSTLMVSLTLVTVAHRA